MTDFLDDELLEFAAGGAQPTVEHEEKALSEEGEADSRSPTPHSRRSPSRSISRSLSRSRSPQQHSDYRSPPPKRTPKMPASARKKSGNASAEAGEASSHTASPRSLGSGAMDESDSDADAGSDVDSDAEFRLEGKYKNAKDRAWVESLPQLQREELLAERIEKVNNRRNMLRLQQMVAARDENDTIKSKKRSASAADFDDESPRRPKAKHADALENLKRSRASKGTVVRRERKTTRRRSDSAEDALGESDHEVSAPAPVIDVTGELADFQRVRIGRTNYARICFWPNFENLIKGCFARIVHGADGSGNNVYRMCKIVGLTTGKPYRIEDANDRAYIVDTYVTAQYGTSTKDFPFVVCSNSKFNETEYQRYIQACDMDGVAPEKKSFLDKKTKEINDTLSRTWTSREIQQKMERQTRLDHLLAKFAPKQELSAHQRTQEALHQRNLANRKANEKQVHEALLADRIAKRKRAEEIRKKRQEEEKALAEGIDLEAERKREKDEEEARAKPASVNKYVQKDAKKINSFARFKTEDEIIQDMQFDIDIEI